MDITARIAEIGIVPVIKLDNPDAQAQPLAKALIDGGIPVAEVTFRAEGADRAIRAMRQAYPDLLVGAGTVLTREQVDRAVDAGASFLVSPGFNPKTVAHCQQLGVPIVPGCVTPTEIEAALECGLTTLKLFPAEQVGGVAYIKALSAPYGMVRFLPTGGIGLHNLAAYLGCKNVIACGGSFMVTAPLVGGGRWDEITRICKETVELIQTCKNTKNG